MIVYAMGDERYQPIGVAVYRDSSEFSEEQRNDDEFWKALSIVDLDESLIPEDGLFPTSGDFNFAVRLTSLLNMGTRRVARMHHSIIIDKEAR